ncbi:YkgJ family cysteine cluster protein [Thermodesulfobacteriota bacterium]
MKFETDLKKIKQAAEKKEDENWEFRSFLKGYDIEIEELDAIVHGFLDQVLKEIDCTACGNCCREISPGLDQEGIVRLSKGLGMSVENFTERFIVKDEEGGPDEYTFKTKPCPLLKDNLCTQYDFRPEACRSYPHLHKEDFVFRLIGVVQNYKVCPIVFNVYDQLKARLWHF